MTQTSDSTTEATTSADLEALAADALGTDDKATLTRFLAVAESDAKAMDPGAVAMEIIGRVLDAETVDAVLATDKAISSEDYVGRPFVLLSARFSPSQYEGEGPQFFATMTIADENGEKQVLNSSAGRIIAQVFKLRELDAMPVKVVIGKAERPSRAGYYPLWLERAPEDF